MITRRTVLATGAALAAAPAAAQPFAAARQQLPLLSSYAPNIPAEPWSFSMPAYGVLRFEIRTGDEGWRGDPVGVRHRCEVTSAQSVPFNTPIWQAWSQLIEPGDPTRSGFVVCNQWHNFDTGVGRQPCVAFKYENEAFAIETNSDALINPSGNPHLFTRYTGAMPTRGVWHHFVARYVFGDSTHGQLDVWLDGKKIVGAVMPLGCWNDARGPYNKFGVYCADGEDMPAAFAINYANMQIGTENLTELIGAPRSVPTSIWW